MTMSEKRADLTMVFSHIMGRKGSDIIVGKHLKIIMPQQGQGLQTRPGVKKEQRETGLTFHRPHHRRQLGTTGFDHSVKLTGL